MGFGSFILRATIDLLVVSAIILLLPGLPPSGDFEARTFPPPMPLEGALAPDDYKLHNVEKLFTGEIKGAECVAVSPDEADTFYSSLQGGSIVKFTENGRKMKSVARSGKTCSGYWDARRCGRPLALKFDPSGNLIAVDAYFGIFKIDLKTGKATTLVAKDLPIEGKVPKFFNSIALSKSGLIYWTDSSSNYHLDEGMGELLGSPSGRLFVYDPAANQSRVLKDKIHFANGVALSPNEDYLIYAECAAFRLMKFWLSGPQEGSAEVLVDGLPGNPDNLSFTPEGNLFVTMVSVRLPGYFNALEWLYGHPWLQKLTLRVLHIFKMPFDLAVTHLDSDLARKISYQILNMENFGELALKYGMVLEVDLQGKVLRSWHSHKAEFSGYSEAQIMNGYMYLASPFNDYLGRLKMDDYKEPEEPLLTLE